MRQIKKDSTNVSIDIYIIDATDGTPELGVVFNTAGMDLEYRRELGAVVNITEVTLAALTTAWASGGFKEIGHGLYRFDVPDAAFATGVETVSIQGTVTGMIILPQTIQLVDFDPEDGVRLGLTALPNAIADGAGGLPISDAGGLDMDNLQTDLNDIQTRLPATLVSGRIDSSVGAMAAAVLTAAAIAANAITATKIATAAITNAKFAAGAIDAAAIAANAIAEAKIATGAIIAAKFGAGAIDAASLNADAVDKIRDGILPTQNVAFSNIPFIFVAASDHVTPVTSATGSAVTRSIDGGAFGAGTGTIAEVGNGSYQYDASAADMNGGIIQFRFTATGGTPGAPDDVFLTIVTGGGV